MEGHHDLAGVARPLSRRRGQRRTSGENPMPSGPAPTDPKPVTYSVRRLIAMTWFVPWSVTYA